jgi:hypothetical protein
LKREDFNLEVHDGSLTLSGERKFEEPADEVEITELSVLRAFFLPAANRPARWHQSQLWEREFRKCRPDSRGSEIKTDSDERELNSTATNPAAKLAFQQGKIRQKKGA